MTDDSIKLHIKKRREEMAITQGEMAEKLGIDRNTYRSIENGNTRILNSHIAKISEILSTSVEELVFGYNPSKSGTDALLEDYKQLSYKQMEALKEEYEKRITHLKSLLANSEEKVALLSQQVEDKQEIIVLLKSRK